MFIYFLALLLPVYGFIPRIYYDYKKTSTLCSSSDTESTINENIKQFSAKNVKKRESIVYIPKQEPNTTSIEIVRTGKFVDQDGKGNVWSIDPLIKIDQINPNNISVLLNIMTGLGIVSIMVYMLSQFFPEY
tara:strand:- start:11 stop:406 length:396 start_codon:yes stop_codon:yes gene_type:complete